MSQAEPPAPAPEALIRRRRFSLIWLIPIGAAAIAVYLAWHTIAARGPTITVTFRTADGLVPGQTPVKYKAVDLGTVDTISLSDDMSHVIVSIRMQGQADGHLTDQARFWIVRPRVTGGSISGLETLVSGAYIEFDPGPPGGKSARKFTGLEQPPSVRSDEPGKTFTLRVDRLGALGIGAPIFFRDVPVGEVLAYDPPGLTGSITVHAFIRQPFDSYVRASSRFWNASGVNIAFGPEGLKLRLESLQAVIAGGIAFDTPAGAFDEAPAPAQSTFRVYQDETAARAAMNPDRLNFVLVFRDTVRGLTIGAPVQLLGLRVGTVTEIRLEYDPADQGFRVPVHIAVDPEPIAAAVRDRNAGSETTARELAARGLRARLQTANILTGQTVVSLEFGNPPAGPVQMEGTAVVLPADSGGMDNIVNSATDFLAKLNGLPLDQIGRNLNETVASLKEITTSPDLKRSLRSLAVTLANAQDLVRRADRTMGPALERLPQIAADLQQTVQRANQAVTSIDSGYGQDSEFRRNLDRLMIEANDAARSIRLLADFLDRHPEALVRGRRARETDR